MTERVVVYGGRTFGTKGGLKAIQEIDALRDALSALREQGRVAVVISGMASGADSIGAQWARDNRIPVVPFQADWVKWGRAAGQIRNDKMVRFGKPTLAVECPGGTGTADMRARLVAAKIPIIEVRPKYSTEFLPARRRA